jgi:uncharacterized protein DUF1579
LKRVLFLILALASSTLLAAPGPRLTELQPLAGHWTCQGTAFAFLGMPEHKTSATIDGAWTLNNYWFELHYQESKSATNPAPVEVIYFWGWDDQTRKFASSAVDNGGGHFNQSSTGWDGDAITFEGDMHIAGTTMRFHDVFQKAGASTIRHKGEAQIDGKWTKLDEESCTK